MATNTFNSIVHPTHSLRRRRRSTDSPPSTAAVPTNNSPFLRTTTTTTTAAVRSLSSHSAAAAAAATPTTNPQSIDSASVSLDLLEHHLSSQNFRQADEETRRLLIALAGEAAVSRGYVFFSEVQFIESDDLRAVDALWRKHSGGRYGYSVQRRIWKKANCDFTNFFIKVGWMKKLDDSEVEQYNYRAFPGEFIWEMEEGGAPEGHLPLTNALRGTQLLKNIFDHPAFDDDDEDGGGGGGEEERESGGGGGGGNKPLVTSTGFKPNYSF